MRQFDDEFLSTVSKTAKLLGFTIVPDPDNNFAGIFLKDDEGRRIFLRRDYHAKTKLAVSGDYPGDHYDFQRALRLLEMEAPSIGVTLSRGAEVIAREINKRFLPDFIAIHDKVTEVVAQNGLNTAARHKAAGQLHDLLPGCNINFANERADATTTEIRWYSCNDLKAGYGDITVNHDGTSVQMSLKSLPFDVAERVMKALANKEEA
jgi:hypothetical protein